METKWTPGPWRPVDLRHQKNGHIRIFSHSMYDYHRIAEVMHQSLQCEANAKLIAKAPEMAEALLNLREAIRGHEASSDICTCGDPSAKCPIAEAERILREAGAID